MLIGDIWLRKRQAGSQHLLESCNLKFHPLVSAEQARRDHVRAYTGQDQGASPPLSITVVETPARRGDIKSSPRPARAEARRLRKWLPGPDLRRPRLSLSPLLLLRDWMLLCGVTSAASKGPGGHCALRVCVRARSQSARQGSTSSHGDESGSLAAPPDLPT